MVMSSKYILSKLQQGSYSNVRKMGKKGRWLSAIKRVFIHISKEKVADILKNSSTGKKKKKGFVKLRHRDGHSFFPFLREPSSIEKILGEVDREHQATNYKPPTLPDQPNSIPRSVTPPLERTIIPPVRSSTPPRTTPRIPSTPKLASPLREAFKITQPSRNATQPTPLRVPSPPAQRKTSPPKAATRLGSVAPARVQLRRPEPTLRKKQACAIKIQAAYRGYKERKIFPCKRGMLRLQGLLKGNSVKRQTANTLKHMQMFVRLQNDIHSRRIQMSENQVIEHQAKDKNDQDRETQFSKWMSENQDDWDDRTFTKEEREARMKRKFEAIVNRERAMAYAYSHKEWKTTPRMPNGTLAEFRSGGYTYWWNWLKHCQVRPSTHTNPSRSPTIKNYLATPARSTIHYKVSPLSQSSIHTKLGGGLGFDNMDTGTPKSTRSRHAKTPPSRVQPFNGGAFKDDDSLLSCPSFSVPRYMSPTVSANSKLKGIPDSPSSANSEPRKRVSSPFTQGGRSFKLNKGKKNQSMKSIGNSTVDNTVSMPGTVRRKPFNRYV